MGSSGSRARAIVAQTAVWLLICGMALGFLTVLRPGVALSDEATDLVLPTPLPSPSDVVDAVTETVQAIVNPTPSPTPSPSASPTPSSSPSPKPSPSPAPTLPVPVPSPTLPIPVPSPTTFIEEVVTEEVDTIGTADQLVEPRSSAEDRLGITRLAPTGPRSTTEILQLLEGLPPSTVARILAPFPVAGPASYGDDWGAPRFNPFFHLHEGTDIFAPRGTTVIAPVDGIVSRMTIASPVGGTSLRVTGRDGTYYYLAHLDRFAAALFEGSPVVAGDVIGFVGTTGNAEGGAPHLHFEIHPNGGPPVPPVPNLDRWLAEALQTAKLMSSVGFQPFAGSSISAKQVTPKSLGSGPAMATAAFLGKSASGSSKVASWIVFGIPFVLLVLGRRKRRRLVLNDNKFFYM